MILECPVVPEGHDGDLLIEAKKGYYVFYRNLLVNPSLESGTLRITRHESTFGYVAFETKESAETFVKGNMGTISAEEWYVPREVYILHLCTC